MRFYEAFNVIFAPLSDRHSDRHYAITVEGPGGRADGVFELPQLQPFYMEPAGRLERERTSGLELVELGTILFRALFQDKIKEAYSRSKVRLKSNQGLRLRLHIDTEVAHPVAALPWEFLYDPEIQGHLVLRDIPIVRCIPGPPRNTRPMGQGRLKVLVSSARTPPAQNSQPELQAIETVLKKLGDFVEVVVEPSMTTRKLRSILREFAPHVWHFVGHGGLSRENRSLLLFEDENGDPTGINADVLSALLSGQGVSLVVLSACNGAKLTDKPFYNLAPQLIKADIPAVVAMQFPISEEGACAFANEFYSELVEGSLVEVCVNEGRSAVLEHISLPDWGVPVIYTRDKPDVLLKRRGAPKAGVQNVVPPSSIGPIYEGVNALVELMRIPNVYAAVIVYKDNFQRACKYIKILYMYKKLHDQFQDLEREFLQLYRWRWGKIETPSEWLEVRGESLSLLVNLKMLIDLSTQEPIANDVQRLHARLQQAMALLEDAFDKLDTHILGSALGAMEYLLDREPLAINQQQIYAARELRESAFIPSMIELRQKLLGFTLTGKAGYDVATFVQSLDDMERTRGKLDELIDIHKQCQEIDRDIREITIQVERGSDDFNYLFDCTCIPVCYDVPAELMTWLSREAASLDRAIKQRDMGVLRLQLKIYRGLFLRYFKQVDGVLLDYCGRLKEVEGPLQSLLSYML
jgi:hypothetical protein